ncbi:MAG TPA: MFS transporter, partial [Actinopolymorphaceae bacterium]
VYLVRDVGVPPGQIGLFFSIAAVGGLIGAVLVKHVVRWWGQGPTIWRATALTAPFLVLLPFAEPGLRLWLAAAGIAVSSMGGVVYNITQVSFRQAVTPERLLGRMNATIRFLVWGTLPLGALIGGVLGEQLGARTTIGLAALACCLAFLPVYFSPLRRMRELSTTPEDAADNPVEAAADGQAEQVPTAPPRP